MNEIEQFKIKVIGSAGRFPVHGGRRRFSMRGMAFFAAGMILGYIVIGF